MSDVEARTPEIACTSSARISDCGRYRYVLTRSGWLGEGSVTFVMLNPSTADASQDDPTIRRCIGFARRWGFAKLTVVNLYAYRATDPKQLGLVDDPVGPENDEWLRRVSGSNRIVAAWGATKFAAERQHRAMDLLESWRRWPVMCLGLTARGFPRHPLYVKNDATPFWFKGPPHA